MSTAQDHSEQVPAMGVWITVLAGVLGVVPGALALLEQK